jgi:hypothetical protein
MDLEKVGDIVDVIYLIKHWVGDMTVNDFEYLLMIGSRLMNELKYKEFKDYLEYFAGCDEDLLQRYVKKFEEMRIQMNEATLANILKNEEMRIQMNEATLANFLKNDKKI